MLRAGYRERVSWFRRSSPGDEDAVPAPAAAPDVEPLTDDEVVWVRSQVAELADQGVRTEDVDDLGRYYDEMLAGWLRLKEPDRPDPAGITHQVGLALGEHVARRTGLLWRIALTEAGPEIALWRAEDAVVVYPARLVAQCWAARETRVVPTLARSLVASAAPVSA